MILRFIRLPPVLFFGYLLAGLAVQTVVPISLGIPSFELGMAIGSALLVVGVLVAWSALSELRKHGTTEEPGKLPTNLVTSGVFSFSRNPLYLTQLIVLCSLAVMVNSPWLIVSAALLWFTLDRLVVRSEEQLLEKAFAQKYLEYKDRVGRWV